LARPVTSVQTRALARSQDLLNDRINGSLVDLLGRDDVRPVGCQGFELLLRLLKDVFFHGHFQVNFDYLPNKSELEGRCVCSEQQIQLPNPPQASVFLHLIRGECSWCTPAPPAGSVLNRHSMMRLGTLLHELCRAYLFIYVCTQCSSKHVMADNFKGHGAAWQHIATYVKYAARQQLGLPSESN
jgi:hypothetical protein